MRDAVDQLSVGDMSDGAGLYGGAWYVEFDISDDLTSLFPVSISMMGLSNAPGTSASGNLNIEDFPNTEGTLRSAGGFRVAVNGRLAYNRVGDRLTLSARKGKQRVTLRIRGKGGSASTTLSAATLKLRVNYARAVGLPPLGTSLRP